MPPAPETVSWPLPVTESVTGEGHVTVSVAVAEVERCGWVVGVVTGSVVGVTIGWVVGVVTGSVVGVGMVGVVGVVLGWVVGVVTGSVVAVGGWVVGVVLGVVVRGVVVGRLTGRGVMTLVASACP